MFFRKFYCLFLGFLMFVFGACASKPAFSSDGDLCGYVVDENNEPVEEYIISCRGHRGLWKTTITNKNGLFVFENVSLGNCYFRGRKNAYVELEKNMQIFGDRAKVLCFQVTSIDKALDKVEEMILYEDFKGAELLLDQISCEKNSPAEEVRDLYRDYLLVRRNEIEIEGGNTNEKAL